MPVPEILDLAGKIHDLIGEATSKKFQLYSSCFLMWSRTQFLLVRHVLWSSKT